MPLFTPTNQKRLTNVAVVRLKKAGKRFEIACYPNKVNAWREKLEKDLDEVLQTRQVFVNVSKGEGAKKEELIKVFNTEDIDQVCIEILEKGELQVSAKEREEQQDNQFKDVATIVASKCINPVTKKPYTVTSIEQAMKDCHIALRPNRSSKQQALEAIRKLKDTGLKIQRARMRLSIAVSKRQVVDKIRPLAYKIESDSYDDESHVTSMTLLCEPADYRTIDELISKSVVDKGGAQLVAKLDIVDLQVPLDEEEEEGEEGEKHEGEHEQKDQKPKKKSSKAPTLAKDNDDEEPHPRSRGKHQELDLEVKVEEPTKPAKKGGLKGPIVANKPDEGGEDDGAQRRGPRGKFADISADD